MTNEAPLSLSVASVKETPVLTWIAGALLALAWGLGYWIGDLLFFARVYGDSLFRLLVDPYFALELVGATIAGCAAAAYALALVLIDGRRIGWWVPAAVFVVWVLVGLLPAAVFDNVLPTTLTLMVVGGGLGLAVGFGLRPKTEGGGCAWPLLAAAAWALCGSLGLFATAALQRWFYG